MSIAPNPVTAVPGGEIPVATPPFVPSPGGTPDPSAQVGEMTKKLLAALAQASQRKQFAGQPVPAAVPGQQDPNAARQIGMNTANPNAWGKQRFMSGVATSISNAVARQRQQKLLKAEADWTYLQAGLNELYAAQASNDPKAVAAAQQKVDVVMGDPKKLKEMAKALNQDWLNPEKTTVYGEALKKVNSKLDQKTAQDQQKQQAAQGLKGMFQKLLQRKQQPQLSPEQQQAMSREIQAKAPTTSGLDPKALEAQEKILHDRAEEAHQAKQDETSAAFKKAELAIQEARLTQERESQKAEQERRKQELELKQKTEEETTRHHKRMESIQAARPTTGGTSTNAKDIAGAIRRGDQPPSTTGLYREGAGVRAELARSGFNLAQAESDWKATQKHLATLNGPQQERLRQAVSFTSDSLDIINDLYNQWEKVGKTSGFKAFNKASLAASKQLPGEAGSVATRLEAQINDLTAELGTVYKGGNSSTDESLKLAAQNLKADWNERTFKDAMEQIKNNLQIRKNSMKFSEPAGVSADSPYTPQSEKVTMETQIYNGATYQRKKGSNNEWTLAPKPQ